MANKNLPAFASVAISGNDGYQQDGLTKREYAAIQIISASISNGMNIINNRNYKDILVCVDLLFEEMDKIDNSGNIQDK